MLQMLLQYSSNDAVREALIAQQIRVLKL